MPPPALTAAGLLALAVGPGTEYYAGWPPARYNVESEATVHLATDNRIQVLCAGSVNPPHGMVYLGCYRNTIVYCPLPEPGSEERVARCLAHELAHRRFWPGTHPL